MAGYGTSKFCAEQYCGLYTRLHGLSTVTVRLGNVYGPRQDPLGEAGVIAIFCGKLNDGGSADRSTATGRRRATTSTSATSCARRWRPPIAATSHGAINVGTGRETTVLDIAQAMRDATGREDFVPEHAPPRLGELQRSCLDVRRARELLGFEAQVDIAEGIRLTVAAELDR